MRATIETRSLESNQQISETKINQVAPAVVGAEEDRSDITAVPDLNRSISNLSTHFSNGNATALIPEIDKMFENHPNLTHKKLSQILTAFGKEPETTLGAAIGALHQERSWGSWAAGLNAGVTAWFSRTDKKTVLEQQGKERAQSVKNALTALMPLQATVDGHLRIMRETSKPEVSFRIQAPARSSENQMTFQNLFKEEEFILNGIPVKNTLKIADYLKEWAEDGKFDASSTLDTILRDSDPARYLQIFSGLGIPSRREYHLGINAECKPTILDRINPHSEITQIRDGKLLYSIHNLHFSGFSVEIRRNFLDTLPAEVTITRTGIAV
jgi:hypothetical protein